MADRVAPGAFQQLHHFISASTWRPEPLEFELVRKAQDLVGGADAVLAIDDTALVKQGSELVGVAHQYCGQLGKQANCQVLVSLTLARREVPVCVGLRRSCRKPGRGIWTVACAPAFRCPSSSSRSGASPWRKSTASGVPGRCSAVWPPMPNMARWRISGPVWQSAGCATPSHSIDPDGLSRRRHARARSPQPDRSPGQAPVPSVEARTVGETIAALPAHAWRFVSWRTGTKGRLRAGFVALRVCVADGVRLRTDRRLPGSVAWLVCEQRTRTSAGITLSGCRDPACRPRGPYRNAW